MEIICCARVELAGTPLKLRIPAIPHMNILGTKLLGGKETACERGIENHRVGKVRRLRLRKPYTLFRSAFNTFPELFLGSALMITISFGKNCEGNVLSQ